MHLIVNPAAAGGRLGRSWESVRQRLAGLGLDVPFSMTEAPGHATELAARAVAQGADVVVAVGGDGTVTEVLTGIHGTSAALGLLPLGTGNDAARTLGIPLGLEGSVHALQARARRRIDLVRAGEHIVLNAIGIGLLGAINERAADFKFVRGIAGYLAAAVEKLFTFQGVPTRLVVDGEEDRTTLTAMAVHNGPTTGGGFRLAPGARVDDGFIDACLVGPMGALARARRLVAALCGNLGEMPGSRVMRFRRMELWCEEPIPWHWDGNLATIQPPGITFEVLPGAIEVVGSVEPAPS